MFFKIGPNSYLIFIIILKLIKWCRLQPFYYPSPAPPAPGPGVPQAPPPYYNYHQYYVPPHPPNYNICPEDLYFFDYEPFISAQQQSRQLMNGNRNNANNLFEFTDMKMMPSASALKGSELDSNHKQNITDIYFPVTKSRKENSSNVRPQMQSISSQDSQLQIQGPFWQILRQTYEKCCPLNKNRLKSILLQDDLELFQNIFVSFSNQSHILHHKSEGMFAIVEQHNSYQQFDSPNYNPYTVQILSSSGFYLISKRELNGAPTMTPIALSILLNAWPMLIIILLANAYAAIFIWFLDRTLKTRQFPNQFSKGTIYGLWWSFFLFTATSVAPRIEVRKWVIRIFTVIWIMVSFVIVVIFIAMFTSSLTIYAMNGQSLYQKIIGINKYSTDRIWLDTENSVAVEYNTINDMFRDLDDLKLDFILVDQIFANFYSKLIGEKFYVMRQVSRKRSFNILMRGFNPEHLTCFQTVSSIFAQQWIKSNLSSNINKIKDTSRYFNLTDELLYPQRNVILITAIGLLIMIIIIGISWQISCMKQPGIGGSAFGAGGGAAAFSRRIRDGSGNRRGRSNGFDTDGLNALDGNGEEGNGGGGGISNIGRSLFNQNPITGLVDNISGVRSVIPGGFLSPNMPGNIVPLTNSELNQLQDRSVKFNPLVHNFYYNNNKSSDIYDKALINARDQVILQQLPKTFVGNENDSDKLTMGSQNWNYFKVNNNGTFEEIQKENSIPVRTLNNIPASNSSNMSSSNNNSYAQNDYQFIQIPASYFQSKLNNHQALDLAVSDTLLYNQANGNITRVPTFKTNPQCTVTRVNSNPVVSSFSCSQQQPPQYKFKKMINFNNGKKGSIVLNPSNSITSIYNQESNTDENIDTNHILNNNSPVSTIASMHQSPANTIRANSNFKSETASIISNPAQHNELPRNESFYLSEFSSVKL